MSVYMAKLRGICGEDSILCIHWFSGFIIRVYFTIISFVCYDGQSRIQWFEVN